MREFKSSPGSTDPVNALTSDSEWLDATLRLERVALSTRPGAKATCRDTSCRVSTLRRSRLGALRLASSQQQQHRRELAGLLSSSRLLCTVRPVPPLTPFHNLIPDNS